MEKALKYCKNTVETKTMSSCNLFYFSVNAVTRLQDILIRNIQKYINLYNFCLKKKLSEHCCILQQPLLRLTSSILA